MHNILSEHFEGLPQLCLIKTLDITSTYNTSSLITQITYVAPNNTVIKALQCINAQNMHQPKAKDDSTNNQNNSDKSSYYDAYHCAKWEAVLQDCD